MVHWPSGFSDGWQVTCAAALTGVVAQARTCDRKTVCWSSLGIGVTDARRGAYSLDLACRLVGYHRLDRGGVFLNRFYVKASREIALVRTGLGGQRVVLDGGVLGLPIVHKVSEINMRTVRLEVERAGERSIITQDRLRIDATAEFYVTGRADGAGGRDGGAGTGQQGLSCSRSRRYSRRQAGRCAAQHCRAIHNGFTAGQSRQICRRGRCGASGAG